MKTSDVTLPGFYFVSRAPTWPTTTVVEVHRNGYFIFPGEDHLYTMTEFAESYPQAVWWGPIRVPSREEMENQNG